MASDLNVKIYRDQHSGSSSVDTVAAALDELDSQVNFNVDYTKAGEVHLPDAPYGSYGEYEDNFEVEASMREGWDNFLVYNAQTYENYRCCDDGTEYPYVGKSNYELRDVQYSTSVLNEETRYVDWGADKFFENMVVHEVLHAVNTVHSDGENYYEENSPMISAYAESISNNDLPSDACGSSDPLDDIDAWRLRLSACTTDQSEYWMSEEYDTGGVT